MFKGAPTDPEAKLGFCEGQGLWGWVEGLHNFTLDTVCHGLVKS